MKSNGKVCFISTSDKTHLFLDNYCLLLTRPSWRFRNARLDRSTLVVQRSQQTVKKNIREKVLEVGQRWYENEALSSEISAKYALSHTKP